MRIEKPGENRNRFRKALEEFAQKKDLGAFYDVNIRGEKGDVYFCPKTKCCIGAITNLETGKRDLIKAQPLGETQITILETQHRLD